MAQIAAPEIILMVNALLKFGDADSYELSASRAELIPTTPKARFKGIGGSSIPKAGTTTWVLATDFAQDWETTSSLSSYMHTNAGTSVAFLIEPEAGGDGWSGAVLIEPSNIGGVVDSVAVASLSLEVIGQPTRVPAA